MTEKLVAAASSYAVDIDNLITLIAVIVFFWGGLTELVFFWLIWKFRAKKDKRGQYITGETKAQKRWVSTPHVLVLVCDVIIIVAAIRVWVDVKMELPKADQTVRIMAQQWAWSFTHPGADGVIDTEDDIRTVDELRLEVGKTYHYKLEGRDVLHSFSVPAFRLKQDAIPGRTITGWFRPIKAGTFDVQCAEICGIGHALMPGRVVIESKQAHEAWVRRSAQCVLRVEARRVCEDPL